MRTYVLVTFALNLFCIVVGTIRMAMNDYPRQREPEGIGEALAGMILLLAFTFWAANLLWN